MTRLDAIVVGCGPYGLAAAAHLRSLQGFEFAVFGDPMSFWQERMPAGMLLRSSWEASHISDPKAAFTLDRYRLLSGNHISSPIPLGRFVDYGMWFQQQVVPEIDRRKVRRVERGGSGFHVTLDDGEKVETRRVIVAAGICSFAYKPPEFENLPSSLAAHCSENPDPLRFENKEVVVVGGGQSALESAALLHENKTRVEILVRNPEVHWLGWKAKIQKLGVLSKVLYSWTDVGPAGISRLVSVPGMLTKLPRRLQDRLRLKSIRPAGANWLRSRLNGVPVTTERRVISARPVGERVRLVLDDQTDRVVDHVLLGTGYRVDITRYDFLAPEIISGIGRTGGFPQLGQGFQSSIPGLHFLGAPAAWSFGPLMNFVSGTRYTARSLTRYLARSARAS